MANSVLKHLYPGLYIFLLLAFLINLAFFLRPNNAAHGAVTTVSRQIVAGEDDAHQKNDGSWFTATVPLVRTGNLFSGGLRFTNITVPKDAIIDSASIDCYVDSTTRDDPSLRIYADKVDSSVNFTAQRITPRAKTSTSVLWNGTNLGTGYKTSPNISSVVQEVVNRPGWNSGNAVTFILVSNNSSLDFRCISFEGGDTARRAKLNLAYHLVSPSPTPTPSVSITPTPTPPTGSRPNIVVIETDDQRWNMLDYMPNVLNRLTPQGIKFTNSFVTSSLCCPSRTNFLTGQYTHNHGVWGNNNISGFRDGDTIATWLKSAGYRTGFFGKYLNGYEFVSPYIPPGWSDWQAFVLPSYYNYDLNENGVIKHYADAPGDYSNTVLKSKVISFINTSISQGTTFFAWFTPRAPHGPWNIEPKYVGTCDSIPIVHPPSFNETDVSDKPSWIQALPLLDVAKVDSWTRKQICTLKSVDDAVGEIMDALGPQLDNTLFIFTSDNGYMLGEHRKHGKENEFEEANRVPLIIRYPALIAPGTTNDEFALSIDLAPTIADVAAIDIPIAINGKSLVPLFSGNNLGWRTDFLMELQLRTMRAVRNKNFRYVELGTGEKELYDLILDPYELENQINNPAYTTVISQLAARLVQLKQE